MLRSELYEQIKKYGLEAEVKKQFGVNFTNVYNKGLEDVITNFLKNHSAPTCKCEDCKFDKLVNVLMKKRILLKSEFDYIMN